MFVYSVDTPDHNKGPFEGSVARQNNNIEQPTSTAETKRLEFTDTWCIHRVDTFYKAVVYYVDTSGTNSWLAGKGLSIITGLSDI